MKNQYFGDRKDYHKYGLLRAFVQACHYRPMVAWMRTPDDSSTDGQDIRYFEQPDAWARHDPELFGALHHLLVRRGVRKLTALEHLPMFTEFEFFGRVLPQDIAEREAWFERLLRRSKGHDLIFFDPDTGLEVSSISRGQKQAHRYLYYDELAPFVAQDRVLIVYQHYPRQPRPEYEERIAANLRDRCMLEQVTVLRTSAVGFFAGYSSAERDRVERSLAALQSNWGNRFEIVRL